MAGDATRPGLAATPLAVIPLRHEIVANVSEGRDPALLERLADAIGSVPGAVLLDRHADVDHDRCVLTYVGDDVALVGATIALARVAMASIDLRAPGKHGAAAGVHPRIGALDVVPVVPIGPDATIESAAALARTIAGRLGELGLSVHRYAAIARSAERRSLPNIRRGGFEGLVAAQATAAGAPDDGPALPHERAGAVAVGARPAMVAWNVELAGAPLPAQLRAARAIAASIRGSAPGGIAGLQALGFPLASRGCAQVSMNLHEAAAAAKRGDTLHAIRARIGELAVRHGVHIGETEIVGLLPEALLAAGGEPAALAIRGGWERASLERRAAVVERR